MHVHTAAYHRDLRSRRRKIHLPFGAERLLALLEGIEGGFAIGAGTVAGLSLITSDKRLVLITATISLIVNGFNSSAVKYSSEHYTDELDGRVRHNKFRYYFMPALYEFMAYFIVSLVILLPVYFMPHITFAAMWIVCMTLVVLFTAGYWRGYLMHRPQKSNDGIELAALGAAIVLIGIGSGWLLHHLV